MAIRDRLARAWNVFIRNDQTPPSEKPIYYASGGYASSIPHLPRRRYSSERSIISSIYNRICIDVASAEIRHVKVDENNQYVEDVPSSINQLLSFEPNMDQGPRAFKQDIAMTLFDKAALAIVPVDTLRDPVTGAVTKYLSFRVGEIVNWQPKHVRVSLYNEATGNREEITLEKRSVAIVENPLYTVINEPNSTFQRLMKKLNLLDEVDEATSSNRLDIIIQVPYTVKTEARKAQAKQRIDDIQFQLKENQYGIAYTDGTEKITQLNRPAENNLLKQIEFLQNTLYDQLGITKDVMSGTADEATMLNYMDRTIEPILDAITEAMQRSFLGLSGISNGERIRYFTNPFKLVPIKEWAVVADKFSRNEIFSANEIRGFMGIKPSTDPKANELRNSNMPLRPEAEDLE